MKKILLLFYLLLIPIVTIKASNLTDFIGIQGTSGAGISNVVEDTTPQLGGPLDGQGNTISGIPSLTYAGVFAITATDSAFNIMVGTGAGDDFTINTTGFVFEGDTGNVGIGTATPEADALLDVSSTTKAFLPPRMTTAQRDAIPTPTKGMLIYNTTTNVLNDYNGTSWADVGADHAAVTVSGTPNYITLTGQDLVRAKLDIADDINIFTEAQLYTNLSDVTNFLQTGDAIAGDDITDGSVDETELATTLNWANGTLLDFGTNISSATEGIFLPGHLTSCASATAEGQVCWEEDANTLWIGDGAAAKSFEPGGSGDFSNGGDTAGAARELGNNDAQHLTLETSGIDRIRLDADGRVTIGDNASSGNGTLMVTETGTHAGLTIRAVTAGFRAHMPFDNGGANKWNLISAGTFDTPNDRFSIMNTNSTSEKFTILQGGNVGIGANNPSTLFEVQGVAGSAGLETLSTAELTIIDGDKLGQLNFQAPLESSGTDAILAAASIWAEADATFDTATNTASLVFATSVSETATEKMRLDSAGNLGIGTVPGPTNQLHLLMDGAKDILFDGSTNPRTIDTGLVRIEFTPSIPNTRCFTTNINVNSMPSTHSYVANIVADGLVNGETATGLQVNIDTGTSTGGVVRGITISKSGAGAAAAHGVHVDPGVDVITQFSGSFVNVTQGWDENGGFLDTTTAFNSSGTDVTVFDADDDKIYMGLTTTFDQIRVNLDTFAGGAGISPVFEYSSGGGTPVWTVFTPKEDGTFGFRQNGNIAWMVADLVTPTWAVATVNADAGDKFYIRITRTQNTIPVDPIEDTIQVQLTNPYEWNEIGELTVLDIDVGSTVLTSRAITTDTGGVLDVVIGTAAGDDLNVTTSGGDLLTVEGDTGDVGVGTTDPVTRLTVEGTLSLKEQADADADTAAYGQIWINTATPNEAFFTNDAGADFQLGVDPTKNLLINGGFSVAQRGTSFTAATIPANSDDTYLLDRTILLSDGNDVVDVTQQTGGGVSGNEDYIRLDVETAQLKFGILKIAENKNTKPIIGSSASLSFEAKVTNVAKLTDIRAVVLSWDSTADTVTSDIVSAWSTEGTRPVYATNWTAENVDADLSVTTSWVRYTIDNISIDTASAANVGVFIYQNDVATNDTVGIFLEITNVQLQPGTISTNFEYKDHGTILANCKRYYEELNNGGVATFHFATGLCISTTAAEIPIFWEVEKRTIPTLADSAAGDFFVSEANGAAEAVTVFTFDKISIGSAKGVITVGNADLVAGNGTNLTDSGGNARITINSEL